MATCKDDCLHHPVCRLPFNTSKTQVEFAQVCHHFKNKADVVEVKHGEWIETDYKTFDGFETETHPNEGLKCSMCNHVFRKKLLWCGSYCPNCGAKMDEERKVENGRKKNVHTENS